MQFNTYTINDKKVGYGTPFFMVNDEVVKRHFTNVINSTDPSEIKTNMNDLEVVKIASYDDTTGIITPLETIETIFTLKDLFKEDKYQV